MRIKNIDVESGVPRTKEEWIKTLTVALGVGVVSGISTGIGAFLVGRKVDGSWRKRDRHWREIFDSAMRINDILQETSLTEEEREEKIKTEMKFIKMTRRWVED